jgi:hypothetical protein
VSHEQICHVADLRSPKQSATVNESRPTTWIIRNIVKLP